MRDDRAKVSAVAYMSFAVAGVLASACGGESGLPSDRGVAAGTPDGGSSVYVPSVIIDGRFDDWDRDVAARPGAATMMIRDDPRAVYLALPLQFPDNIQGLDGALILTLDADDDSTTGVRAFDLPGVDFVVSFTRLLAPKDPRHGVAWWRPDPSDPDRVTLPSGAGDPYDLGLWFEPRHTARRVEVRLARDRPGPGFWNGSGFSGKLLFVDRDGVRKGGTPVFRHSFVTDRDSAGRPGPVDLARAEGADFRLVSWNVSRSRIARSPDPARAILAALEPDLVFLDEIPPGVGVDEILGLLPGGGAAGWSVHVGTSGSLQRGAVAARGTVAVAPDFSRVAYADSVRALLEQSVGAEFMEVAANVATSGVPATGAWVTLGGRRFLAVTLDLVCCGNSMTSVQDVIRRIEADAIRGAASDAMEAAAVHGTGTARAPLSGVLIGGDFNLVGSRQPLDILATGLGPDGSDLESIYALQLDGATSATWTSDSGPFPPGQLDYVLYPPSLLTPLRAFVFETLDVPVAQLDELGLTAELSDLASDHRPVVVDFAWR
ncbi:MAG: endonuclease/exonuclease/phosphatase family protein [Gemmatimonadota bacterium]